MFLNGTQRIVLVNGHYEAYDSMGHFICSGNTQEGCYEFLKEKIVKECQSIDLG